MQGHLRSARAIYLRALKEELFGRRWDLSSVDGLRTFPGKRKFLLERGRLLYEDRSETTGLEEAPGVMVPGAGAPWQEIWRFALTYNGYERHGGFDDAAKLAMVVRQNWQRNGALPEDLDMARGALFFEQRACRWQGEDPGDTDGGYVRALVKRIGDLSGGWITGPVDALP